MDAATPDAISPDVISPDTTMDAVTLRVGDLEATFEIDDYTAWRLLEGLDDIGLTLRDEDAITAFESTRESWRPRTIPVQPQTVQ